MKKVILAAVVTALCQNVLAAEQAFTGNKLPDSHKSCIEAWQKVIVDGDITSRELWANGGVAVAGTTAALAASKVSAASTTSVKVAAIIAGGLSVVALSNMSFDEQMEAVAAVKREALIGSGATLEAVAELAREEAANTDADQIKQAINSITDWQLKGLCTRDNNPVVFGRYIELIMGKIKRDPSAKK